jgi:hypothetical protein
MLPPPFSKSAIINRRAKSPISIKELNKCFLLKPTFSIYTTNTVRKADNRPAFSSSSTLEIAVNHLAAANPIDIEQDVDGARLCNPRNLSGAVGAEVLLANTG